jgi:hypothetical protein
MRLAMLTSCPQKNTAPRALSGSCVHQGGTHTERTPLSTTTTHLNLSNYKRETEARKTCAQAINVRQYLIDSLLPTAHRGGEDKARLEAIKSTSPLDSGTQATQGRHEACRRQGTVYE